MIPRQESTSQNSKLIEGRPTRERSHQGSMMVGILLVSTLFIKTGPAGLAWSDGLLVIFVFCSFVVLLRGRTPDWFEPFFRPFILTYILWLSVLLLSTLIAGAPGSGVLQTAKYAVGPFYFLVTVILLFNSRPEVIKRIILLAATFGLCLLAGVTYLTSTDLRSAGTFDNPNLTATWSAAFILIVIATKEASKPLAVLALLAGAVVLLLSASFAAYVGIFAVIAYVLLKRPRILAAIALGILPIIVIGSTTNVLGAVLNLLDPAQRADRSAADRGQIWATALQFIPQHLVIGIGPGQFAAQQYVPGGLGLETHNDYLGTLVETGIPGLILVITLFVILWRKGASATHSMIILIAITGTFHNVLDFRHYWIALGIAFVIDQASGHKPFHPDPTFKGIPAR
jgi:O-antigen ligase